MSDCTGPLARGSSRACRRLASVRMAPAMPWRCNRSRTQRASERCLWWRARVPALGVEGIQGARGGAGPRGCARRLPQNDGVRARPRSRPALRRGLGGGHGGLRRPCARGLARRHRRRRLRDRPGRASWCACPASSRSSWLPWQCSTRKRARASERPSVRGLCAQPTAEWEAPSARCGSLPLQGL